MVWAYPRGGKVSKEGETAIDVVAYAAHIAAQLGAHIIKVKLPTEHRAGGGQKIYEKHRILDRDAPSASGTWCSRPSPAGASSSSPAGAKDRGRGARGRRGIREGGGYGSIIGRNAFQRPKAEAIAFLHKVMVDLRLNRDLALTRQPVRQWVPTGCPFGSALAC